MKRTTMIAGLLIPLLMVSFSAAHAQNRGGGSGGAAGGSVSGQGMQDQTRDRIQDPTTHTGDEPLQTQDQDRTRLYTSTTTTPSGTGATYRAQSQGNTQGGATNTGAGYMNQEQYRLMIEPEHIQYRASTSAALGQAIQQRQRELQQEASDTAAQNRAAIQNANQVRLAVYSLLSAQDLLGAGIGQQVAQIASQIDNSVQTTTNAQAQIQARGFLTRFFFGGDSQSAAVITQAANENQTRIQQLTQLLSQASTSPEVRSQLQTQVQTIQQEQQRLQQLADQERKSWGLFSWRF